MYPFTRSISFGLLRPVYISRNINATLPRRKVRSTTAFGLILFPVSPRFSAISCKGSFCLILPSALFESLPVQIIKIELRERKIGSFSEMQINFCDTSKIVFQNSWKYSFYLYKNKYLISLCQSIC